MRKDFAEIEKMSEEQFDAAARRIWDETVPGPEGSSAGEAFESFKRRTGYKKTIIRKVRTFAVATAAAAAVAIGFWSGYSKGVANVEPPVAIKWAECRTGYGQNRSLTLPDGTKIWVNAATRVLYPESFCGNSREIYLSGEIYLEVAKDTSKPFIVNAGDMKIRVTGTKFNVKAYSDDNKASTTLIEGGVTVSVPEEGSPIALTPGNTLSFDRQSKELHLYPVQNGMEPSWYKGEFNAYHATLEEIAKDLERRFGVQIVIRNPIIAEEIFYASFVNHESVEEILKYLNIDGTFKIAKNGNVIDIY